MQQLLPDLGYQNLQPTRDYLREVCLVLGSLQRACIKAHPRDWQHGLEVNSHGLTTQPMQIDGQKISARLDLIKNSITVGENIWPLGKITPKELLNDVNNWLGGYHQKVVLEKPTLSDNPPRFSAEQSKKYFQALVWANNQFKVIEHTITGGLLSPIFLYPHHFDLSLVWFPKNDDKQVGIGFSTGDTTIAEPYFYITIYPEPPGLVDTKLCDGAYWQTKSFTGAILPYAQLVKADDPDKLFKEYALLMTTG